MKITDIYSSAVDIPKDVANATEHFNGTVKMKIFDKLDEMLPDNERGVIKPAEDVNKMEKLLLHSSE